MSFQITVPQEDQIAEIAAIWHTSWHDAHAAHVPRALTEQRSLEDFIARLPGLLERMRIAEADGRVVGLCVIVEDEMQQLFVAPDMYGCGVAQALLRDAEERLAVAGIRRAWLACVIENARAAAFYRKVRWQEIGRMVDPLETSTGVYKLCVLRFEKTLGARAVKARGRTA